MEIHRELLKLREKEKQITSEILSKLQEMEDCRGYLGMGYSSLFDYLVRGLKYSEATAYQRQACVRLAKEVPEIKQKIDNGTLTTSSIATVFKHIRHKTIGEKRRVLKQIENKSTREVKRLFTGTMPPVKVKKTQYQDKVYVRLELTHNQNEKLEKLRALKSHTKNLEDLFESLVDDELIKYEKTEFKPTKSQDPRQISKRLRNHVLKKAHYRCQYPGCHSTHFLQIDHIHPVRLGGNQHPDNLQVLCASHNLLKG